MASTDILTAAENYGDAVNAFKLALNQANQARKQAMFDIGADYIQQGGQTLTSDEVGKALGGAGFEKPTAMKAGFGTRGLSLIAQEQAGTAYQQDVNAQERGLTLGSGVREAARLVAQEAGQEATEEAFRGYQASLAEAAAGQAEAKAEELAAKAEYDTVRGRTSGRQGGRQGGRNSETKQEAAKRRASARAAANQRAKAAGKPMPYGAGGAPKPKPAPGVKPPSPSQKKGKK